MIEIITRSEAHESQKRQVSGFEPQISFNSDERLVIRLINCRYPLADTLIVLDPAVSRKVIGFCQEILTRQNGKLPHDYIPF